MIRGFSCAILLLCAWLLSGCEKFAIVPVNSTPTPAFSTIPIPERTLEPESIVNLTIADITGTIATQNQVAVIWTHAISDVVSSKPRYMGLLDITASRLLRLNAVIDAGGWMSGQWIKWSPDGTKLMYLPPWIWESDSIQIFQIDNSYKPHSLYAPPATYAGINCDWSPYDGRYITCAIRCQHQGSITVVHDTTNWKVVCKGYYRATACSSPSTTETQCSTLLLSNGKYWDPVNKVVTPSPTKVSDSNRADTDHSLSKAIVQLCERLGNPSRCSGIPSPSERFVIIEYDGDKLLLVDAAQKGIWRLSDSDNSQNHSWSTDERYFSWIEEGQVRVFDTNRHVVTAYAIPDATALNAAWSPAQ